MDWTIKFKTTFEQEARFTTKSSDIEDARASFEDYLLNQLQSPYGQTTAEVVSIEPAETKTGAVQGSGIPSANDIKTVN